MIITPSPVDQAEAAATDAPVPNNQATSLESPELVIPAPVGLTVEYMPGSPVTPEIAKSEDRVGTTGIASAATAGAVAAAAIAATDDTEDLQDAPAVTAKSPAASALAPPISLPSSTEVVTEEDTAVSTVDEAPASPKAADTVVVEAPEAQDDESVVKPSEPEPETAKAPIVPAIVTAEPVSKNASEEPATPVQEPAEQPSARTPPPVTTTVLLSPESPSLDDHKQAISTPTAPLESFMSNAPVDDVKEPLVGKQPLVEEAKVPLDDVKSDLEDVKAEIGAEIPDSPSASMEEAIAKETIATLPVLPSINVGSTYKIVSDDALTPPLSPLDSPIVTAEFKAATEISPVPAAPPKDDVPSNHNGVPRENAPATPTPRTPSVGTATAALATMTVDANDGSEAPPVPEKLAAPVQAKLASPSSTPQKADTLTPRRVSKAGLNGDGSPSSFRSSPRTVSGPATPGSPGTDPTLDDFMGLFKTVIGRDKSMTIREAARKAEDRPVA
jgi:hypothetical protein